MCDPSDASHVVVQLLPLRASSSGETLGADVQEVAEGRAIAEWRRVTPAGPLGGVDLRGSAMHVYFGSVHVQPAGTQQAFLSGTVSSCLQFR